MLSHKVLATLLGFLPSTVAHGFIEFPPLRGGILGRQENIYCPHCGNGAGVCGDGGQWGDDSDFLNFGQGPVTTLRAGKITEFSVQVRAHHMGFFEFSVCDKHVDGSLADPQACFNQRKLRRAPPDTNCKVNDPDGDCQPLDKRHPERWYLPPGVGTYKMRYEIPETLRCSSCTLQWQWFTANSCTPGEDTGCYWADFAAKGWNTTTWCGAYCGQCSSLLQADTSSVEGAGYARGCGEEFRNCADIAVVMGDGDVSKTTSSADASTTTTRSAMDTFEPEVEPEVEPEPETTLPPTPSSTPNSKCGTCQACMWSTGLCYTDASKSYCESWPENLWCGGASLAQVRRHTPKFLGLGLIQNGTTASRGALTGEL